MSAVLIASPGDTHADLVLSCLAADKPVLCEKPLATTAESAAKVLAAELAHRRRLVQVGFMRRYDPGYRAVKAAVDAGSVGDPLLLHCVHRNVASPPGFSSDMSMTESVVHEIDAARWLLGAEIVTATAVPTRTSPLAPAGLCDPQFVLLRAATGAIVDVEVFVNCQYGYEVRCELVGSVGTISLENPSTGALTRHGSRGQPVPADWRDRFALAYQHELQEWVDGAAAGELTGPDCWDGYAATVVAQACVTAIASGSSTPVVLPDRPQRYAAPGSCRADPA